MSEENNIKMKKVCDSEIIGSCFATPFTDAQLQLALKK